MNVFILLLIFLLRSAFTTVVIQPAILDLDNHYCKVTEPVHSYTFNFLGLSNQVKDSIIRFDEKEYLRVHFCHPLIKQCGGRDGYAVCLRKMNGKEVGVGKEPPNVDVSSGRILFRYTGDKCNATHNYTINFEMKCDFSMEYEAAVDMDVLYDRHQCDYHMVLETLAACTRRIQTDCSVTDKSDYYTLSSLTDTSDNYDVHMNENLTVILNVCHSLLYGEHYQSCNAETAICLANKTDETNISYTSLGMLEEDSHVYIVDGNLQISYTNGSFCDLKHSNKSLRINSTITFICDLSAIKSLPTYVGGLEDCHYRFIWKTIAACSEQLLHNQSLVSSKFCVVKDPLINYVYDLTVLDNKVFKSKQINGIYEFTVCNPLRRSLCKGGSGVCRTIDGQSRGISGGIANAHLMWKETGPYLNYTNGNACPNNRRMYTIIAFICGQDNLLDIEEKPCSTIINWTTDMVCRKVCATLDGNISLQQLSRPSGNYVIRANDTEYHLNICRALVPEEYLTYPYGAAVCKVTVDAEGKLVDEINLGLPNQSPRMSRNGVAVLTYENGSICADDHNKRITSRISFLCDYTINKGFPVFKNYSNCIYDFEWKTKFGCGKVNSTLSKSCIITNKLGDFWDLSALGRTPIYNVTEQYQSKKFNISICGGKDVCNSSFICDSTMNYGQNVSVIADYVNDVIQIHYTNGSKCKDGSNARSIVSIKCNESVGLGRPTLSSEQFCSLEFEWVTDAICKPQKYLSGDIEANNLSLPEESSAITIGQIISILLSVFLIIIAYCYFQNDSRRSHFIIYLRNFISKYNLCCKKTPQPIENLCL